LNDRGVRPLTVVLASANRDKAREIRAILEPVRTLALLPRPEGVPEVEETGETLLDNARLKAAALVVATGHAAVADDTGLEVDALGGAPGVRSARFSGEHATYAQNVALLLNSLKGVPAPDRTARFKTVALLRLTDGTEVWSEGIVAGRIAEDARGDEGFGYDPVFAPDEGDGRTFAEMSPDEKHALSHRGRAFRALAQGLDALG
jgi:XTP/dITP diphosphohydrolase